MLFPRQSLLRHGNLEAAVVRRVDVLPVRRFVFPAGGRGVDFSREVCRHDLPFPVADGVAIPFFVPCGEALGNEGSFRRGSCHVSS